jgi:cell division protein FtsB
MTDLPASIAPLLRRLTRRIAVGQFLEVWPRWATASLLIAGTLALISRIFFASAGFLLPWLWLAPLLATIPAILFCLRRAYRPAEVAALADSLSGGHGTLLTIFETGANAWSTAVTFPMPRLRPWRKLAPVLAAALFLVVTMFMPQRVPAAAGRTVLANDIVADLKSTVEELKQQELLTTEEAKNLEQEIERIRRDAQDRVDSSSWEAADALREKMSASLSQKEDALHWAEDSLARFAAAAQAGNAPTSAESEELANAIEKLAQTGMLSDAPADLQKLLGGEKALAGGQVKLPKDPAQLRRLAASLAQHLGDRSARLGDIRRLSKESGRFDPSEFGEFNFDAPDGDGDPGNGGINRGRGDANLTWGDESLPFDRFKSATLPPGAVRSPDDWSPVAVLPGAPKEAPELSGASSGLQFAGTAGQAAWRRTLAPRHYSAVKRYFENSEKR